jgi:TPR repeat protein
MLCAALVLVSVIVDNYDERDNERYYHRFAHFFQALGYVLFCAAVVVPLFTGSAPREYVRDRARAEKGDAAAQYSVGRYLWYGDGVRQDFGEALDWLHKSAEQGDGDAMNLIGYMYEHGQGVRTNTLEAATWYRRGVAAGSARAQNNLGLMYMDLKIAPKDYVKGVEYLRMAAEQGHHRAMFNLGKAYRDGKGVEQSYPQAHAWFSLSVTADFEYGTEYARSLESDMDADERREAQSLEDEWRRTHPRGR